MVIFHLGWTERMSRKTHTYTCTQTGNWQSPPCVTVGCEGGHRGQSTACLCVCVYPIVNRDKRHMPCHRLSPLSLLPLLFSPFTRFLLFSPSSPVPSALALVLRPLRLLAASVSSSNPHPTWSAC